MPAKPHPEPTPRRNRTRQRERLLEALRESDRHPTATELWEALRGELPSLSLGTVYRNLEILVSQGDIESVPTADGAVRYDGNPEPHHHFVCESCGEIRDIVLRVPRNLQERLRRKYRLRARRTRIDFLGLCSECRDREDPR